jgi:predicted Zn-dependent protease with MMP-like domain
MIMKHNDLIRRYKVLYLSAFDKMPAEFIDLLDELLLLIIKNDPDVTFFFEEFEATVAAYFDNLFKGNKIQFYQINECRQ